jgi:hypothetical protein
VTASLLPIIPMPKALKQIFHAKQHFSIFHARSQIQDAAAEVYQLAVPGLNTAFRVKP